MSYYFSKTVGMPFDDARTMVIERLKDQGFGVLTTIDVAATLKEKIGIDFPKYVILGACNPTFAHKALLAENKIGTMLPCNVIVRETESGATEVAAVDPVSSMQAIDNPALGEIAVAVREKMASVVKAIG